MTFEDNSNTKQDGNGLVPVGHGMVIRNALITLVAALCIPSGLLIINSFRNGSHLLADGLGLFVANWSFMAAPFAFYLVAQAMKAAREFAFLTVVTLSLMLIVFQCWIWWWVPGRESSLAWALYIPLWIVVLSALLLLSWIKTRQRSR